MTNHRSVAPFRSIASLAVLAGATTLAACTASPEEADRGPATIAGPSGALYVDDGGDGGDGGLPVVFVHSAAGNTTQWQAQLEHLRPERRAIALDVRGHGRSDAPSGGDYSVEAMATDVAAVVDTLDLDRFVLVGHSMGASVALEYAASHPDRLAGLMLVDGAGVVPEGAREPARRFVERLRGEEYDTLMTVYWTEITRGGDSAATARVFTDMRATPQATIVGVMPHLLEHDNVAAFERYPGPALLVLTPIGNTAGALHHHVDGLPHVLIDSVGHWVQMDRPEAFNALLDRFIEEVEAE